MTHGQYIPKGLKKYCFKTRQYIVPPDAVHRMHREFENGICVDDWGYNPETKKAQYFFTTNFGEDGLFFCEAEIDLLDRVAFDNFCFSEDDCFSTNEGYIEYLEENIYGLLNETIYDKIVSKSIEIKLEVNEYATALAERAEINEYDDSDTTPGYTKRGFSDPCEIPNSFFM